MKPPSMLLEQDLWTPLSIIYKVRHVALVGIPLLREGTILL